MQKTPQVLRGVRVRSKPPFADLPAVRQALAAAQRALEGCGRVNLRYSGTEPVARVMIEGDDQATIERMAEELCAVIRKEIGEERA
jgi:phosphoglucosamine mutase